MNLNQVVYRSRYSVIRRKHQWWAKSNRDSIRLRFESQRRFDSNIARFDSSTKRYYSIQILTIRFRRHAIWTEIANSQVEVTYSVRSYYYLHFFSFQPSLIYAHNFTLCSIDFECTVFGNVSFKAFDEEKQQEVKVIWQKAPHGGPISRLGVTPGGRKLYHWIPGVGFPISVP